VIEAERVKVRCRCHTCGKRFVIMSTIGPSRICDTCGDILLGIIWGCKITGRDKFGAVTVERSA
jgi:hypothetical protein